MMRKIAIFVTAIIIAFCSNAYAKDNVIYEANLQKTAADVISLNVKSDYKEPVKTVKTSDKKMYFEIKDAQITDGFKTESPAGLNLIVQQIGSKVRFYVEGDMAEFAKINITSSMGQKPFDYGIFGLGLLIFAFVTFVAIRFYSATIKLASYEDSIKFPSGANSGLNTQLYNPNRKPEIVYSKVNAQKSEIVDFKLAKNKKSIKIAI